MRNCYITLSILDNVIQVDTYLEQKENSYSNMLGIHRWCRYVEWRCWWRNMKIQLCMYSYVNFSSDVAEWVQYNLNKWQYYETHYLFLLWFTTTKKFRFFIKRPGDKDLGSSKWTRSLVISQLRLILKLNWSTYFDLKIYNYGLFIWGPRNLNKKLSIKLSVFRLCIWCPGNLNKK